MKYGEFFTYFLLVLLLLSGCGSGSDNRGNQFFPDHGLDEGDIIRIEITTPPSNNGGSGGTGEPPDYQDAVTLDAGTITQLSADGYDVKGNRYENPKNVIWTSDNPEVATVDNTGEVTGKSPGEATITVKLNTVDGQVLIDTIGVTVLPSPVSDKKWVTAGVILLQAMWDHASTIWNGYIYVAGGNSSCDQNHDNCGFTDRVYYAPINLDRSVGSFLPTTPMPRSIRGHALIAYNNYMYIIGGIVQPQFGEPPYPDPLTFQTVLNEKVYYAAINLDGRIGEWKETAPLNLPDLPPEKQDKAGLFAASATVINGYIYVMGGWNVELKKNVKTVLVGPLNDDGSISYWIHNSSSDLPYDLSKHASVAATVNGDNYIYIIGGNSGAIASQVFHREIYYAKISKDGFPSNWKRAANVLPAELIDHAAVAMGRYIFVLGGRNRDDNWAYTPYSNVYYYVINNFGDLEEPLKRYPSMPTPLFHHAAVADNSTANIYVTGGVAGDTGQEENRKNTVYYLIETNP